MKNKLRTISVNNQKFFYFVKTTDYNSIVALKIFLSGFKKTPLTVTFVTCAHPLMGNRFFIGIILKNKITKLDEVININFPRCVRKFLLHGQEIGWNGQNKIDNVNGIVLLKNWNYDTSQIAYYVYDSELKKTVMKYYI